MLFYINIDTQAHIAHIHVMRHVIEKEISIAVKQKMPGTKNLRLKLEIELSLRKAYLPLPHRYTLK